ncbi:hypothetical protein ACH5RR_034185 [Cinchona calisaya]|uniref:Uncharacterized protein n=1 Tax=Cinchona calisaya TaxID=153742 RepID=A0ABD2YA62_9GENT
MASHKETHRELEVEVNTDQVEGPYDVHDNKRGSEDPKLNAPIGRFLGDERKAGHKQQEKETGQTSLSSSDLSVMVLVITQAFQTIIQQSLDQSAKRPQPPPVHRENDLEDYFVVISKIGVPFFERGVDIDKAVKWFGWIEEVLALLKVSTNFLETLSSTYSSSLKAKGVHHVEAET